MQIMSKRMLYYPINPDTLQQIRTHAELRNQSVDEFIEAAIRLHISNCERERFALEVIDMYSWDEAVKRWVDWGEKEEGNE